MTRKLSSLLPSLLFLFAALLAAPPARAERPVIDLTGARVQTYPLALAPPLGAAEPGRAVLQVLAAALDRRGLFRLLAPNSFLADPREGIEPKAIDFSRWMSVGAQGLVKAVAQVTGDTVQVEFHLYDPARGVEQMHGTYSAPSAGQRQIAHRFADDLVRF